MIRDLICLYLDYIPNFHPFIVEEKKKETDSWHGQHSPDILNE